MKTQGPLQPWAAMALLVSVVVLIAVLTGCAGRPTAIPPGDPQLRRTSVEFAVDATKRHPYKADAPRGGQAVGRAEVNYGLDLINLVNLSDEEWNDVEIWVNQNYVVFLSRVPRNVQVTLNFQMLYDADAHSFPTDNKTVRVEKLEMLRGGKMYEIPLHLSD